MRNWANVSFAEFEAVVGDLLGAALGVRFERFSDGPDGGIDLRHCGKSREPDIVQCKHFRQSSWPSLLRAAKKELPRLQALRPKPRSYRFVTSASLTPARKRRIEEALSPYIASEADVYGMDDLEGLLDCHPDVERRHIKLWLANGPQLEALLRPGVSSRSRSLAAAIQRALPLYVQSDVFFQALDTLETRHSCLIAGPPGIGKTTLAHMLIAETIRHDFEPIEISSDIDEAWDALDKKRRQIFLYDDFLGHTTLGALSKNEDSRLLRFMSTVQDAPNSLFVMTTREYILREASRRYEAFRRAGLEADRLVLQLEAYSPLDRARILHNHAWHSDVLDRAALESLADHQGYRKIIEHDAFNPRVIEYITGHQQGHAIESGDWLAFALRQLNEPTEIWRTAYEELGPAPRVLLNALATFPDAVLHEDLRAAFDVLGGTSAERDFADALRIVDDSFASTSRPDGETLLIEALDPGVRDFLEKELASRPERVRSAVASAIFFEQLDFLWELAGRYELRDQVGQAFVDRVQRVWDTPSSATIWDTHLDGSHRLERQLPSDELRLIRMIAIARSTDSPLGLTELVETRLREILTRWTDGSIDPSATIALISQLTAVERPTAPLAWPTAVKQALTLDPWHVAYWQALAALHAAVPSAFGADEWTALTSNFTRFATRTLEDDEISDEEFLEELADCAEDFGVELAERLFDRVRDRLYENLWDEPDLRLGYSRADGADDTRTEIDAMFRRLAE